MPKFIIVEERVEMYSATIEAESLEDAKRLYDIDEEETFGDQWEHEETQSVQLTTITELNDHGSTKTVQVFENGEVLDTIEYSEDI